MLCYSAATSVILLIRSVAARAPEHRHPLIIYLSLLAPSHRHPPVIVPPLLPSVGSAPPLRTNRSLGRPVESGPLYRHLVTHMQQGAAIPHRTVGGGSWQSALSTAPLFKLVPPAHKFTPASCALLSSPASLRQIVQLMMQGFLYELPYTMQIVSRILTICCPTCFWYL